MASERLRVELLCCWLKKAPELGQDLEEDNQYCEFGPKR